LDQIKELFTGSIPPRVMRFVKQTGRGINSFNMIKDGDKIIMGISAGKDSLAQALALSLRKKWLPIDYELRAVQIDWKEYPMSMEGRKKLEEYFEILEIPYYRYEYSMFPPSFKGDFNCYLCSRNRKRVLFDLADEWGFPKVSLGHHLDDIVDTTIMNMAFRGSYTTMLPVQEFFKGKLHIIRPMCEVPESMIRNITSFLDLPVENIGCPYKDSNLRAKVKPIVEALSEIDKNTRKHIYQSFWKSKDDFNSLKADQS